MQLSQLKRIIDLYEEEMPDETPVVIALNEPSIGAIRTTEIMQIYPGIDFNARQLLLQTKDKICRLERSKNDLAKMNLFVFNYDKKTIIEPRCPRCEAKLRKDDNYCRECGQHVSYDKDNIVQEYNYSSKRNNEVNING